MAEYVCNYALIRFLPYRDASEFVNIGVALACAPLNFLDFRIEVQRYARVSHFFPELDIIIYRAGLRALRAECDRWRETAARFQRRQPEQGEDIMRHIFGELTRARESLFHFSLPRTALASDPAAKLDQLFTYYVRRQFLAEPVHGEEELRRRMAHSLREFGLERFYQPARIGTPDYHVNLPFVAWEDTLQVDG
ncbi:MAG: DUF3037 domain-containing protein, partial [Armatimonadota bacterium]|nr:DUF3037 domain-containing protein [Armatimonadota bacterium]